MNFWVLGLLSSDNYIFCPKPALCDYTRSLVTIHNCTLFIISISSISPIIYLSRSSHSCSYFKNYLSALRPQVDYLNNFYFLYLHLEFFISYLPTLYSMVHQYSLKLLSLFTVKYLLSYCHHCILPPEIYLKISLPPSPHIHHMPNPMVNQSSGYILLDLFTTADHSFLLKTLSSLVFTWFWFSSLMSSFF